MNLAAAVMVLVVSLMPMKTHVADTVSPREFRSVSIGDREDRVETAWGDQGTFVKLIIDGDQVSKQMRYRTTLGRGTWVWAWYRLGPQARNWWLTKKQWCIINDFSSGYVCKGHPWV